MLKKLAVTSVCLIGMGFTSVASASIEGALANICAIVEADDTGELRKKMRNVQSNFSIRLKDYYEGISCSNMSLIRVAMLNDASQTGTLLVKRMPKSALAAPEADGKTLLAWISEQGLDSHPVAVAVKERL